jgi:undecaprenyl-phosphate 4-deoxy-4-formamido-L-arabinose transferase
VAGPVSVVVPVFNSEDSLRALATRLVAALERAVPAFEVVLVNDGSRDRSWEVLSEISRHDDRFRPIDLMRNYGQHNALLCGIRAARHGTVVTIDDDLQNPPEEIAGLLRKLDEGYDVVYGTPVAETHGFWRDLASRVTKITLQNVMGAETAGKVSAFRAFRTSVREAFSAYRSPCVSIDVLLTWGASRFTSIPVQHDPRRVGQSNYTFRKLVLHALNMTTGFSALPLQLASLAGFFFTFFGVGVFVFVVARYLLQGTSVQGFPFLASVIAVFSGVQLFALGMIGEYLARVHLRTLDCPPYVVRQEASQ